MTGRRALRALLGLVIIGLVLGAIPPTLAYSAPQLEPGTVTEPADNPTYVAVQGFHFKGQGSTKKPARLVRAGAQAKANWVYEGSNVGAAWFYDVDPLPNGNLLAVNTKPGETLVYELNPRTKERVWTETLDIIDTHDVDQINGDELLVANMRNWDEEAGVNRDRVFVYNRTSDEIVWEWVFHEHYPNSTDGGFREDWSHVNDVDKIGDGKFLVSPRNFDQAIVIDRETKEIVLRLGEDDAHEIIAEQHNPDYFETEDGRPVILVADSENDRVVEYTCLEQREDFSCVEWERTWTVGTDQLNWPRDADRLPNGNTLITDTLNHRVIEVTPQGEIVWETYVPWGPYDAERMGHGGGSADGPAMADLGAGGTYGLSNSAALTPGSGDHTTPSELLVTLSAGTPVGGQIAWFAGGYKHITPWVKPIWMSPWSFGMLALAAVIGLVWGLGEAVVHRERLAELGRSNADRVRSRLKERRGD